MPQEACKRGATDMLKALQAKGPADRQKLWVLRFHRSPPSYQTQRLLFFYFLSFFFFLSVFPSFFLQRVVSVSTNGSQLVPTAGWEQQGSPRESTRGRDVIVVLTNLGTKPLNHTDLHQKPSFYSYTHIDLILQNSVRFIFELYTVYKNILCNIHKKM